MENSVIIVQAGRLNNDKETKPSLTSRLLEMIAGKPGITQTTLTRCLSSRERCQIRQALELLEGLGLIRSTMIDTHHRKTKCWHAI